jgi:Leucyl aminopeptidase (aminopeptidase T)
VTDYAVTKNESLLGEIIATDAGVRRLCEIGIGMTRDIDRFSYNMLFDEKIGDTVHMALGRAYEDAVDPDNKHNQSAVHVDMVVDMSENSFIVVDDETIQRDGRFVFDRVDNNA